MGDRWPVLDSKIVDDLDDALDDGNVQVVACSPTIDYSSSVADIGACAFHDSGVRGDPATFTAGDFELYGDSGGNDAFGAGIELLKGAVQRQQDLRRLSEGLIQEIEGQRHPSARAAAARASDGVAGAATPHARHIEAIARVMA